MQKGLFHRACKLVLLFYLVASLSPKYVSLLESTDQDPAFGGQAEERTLVHGIFWLNHVGSELLDTIQSETAPSRHTIGSESEDDDFFLIKRKRAVNRERFAVSPLITTDELPAAPDVSSHPFFAEYSIPHDPIHCHADGYTSLSTGLSPPALTA